MQHLAGESPETTIDELLGQRRAAVQEELARKRTSGGSPSTSTPCPPPISTLRRRRRRPPICACCKDLDAGGVSVAAQYQAETATVQFTIATSEQITRGIFHQLTGALSSHGLEIRTAQIHTLPDGLVLDRFWVHDPDYAGEPSRERLEQVDSRSSNRC